MSQLCAEEGLGQLLWRELVLSCRWSSATSQQGALRNTVCELPLALGGKRVGDCLLQLVELHGHEVGEKVLPRTREKKKS